MKVAIIALCLVCAVSAQFGGFRGPQRFGNFNRGQRPFQQQGGGGGRGVVDNQAFGSQYHYSWNHVGRNTEFTGGEAFNYCRRLGPGWHAIDIDSPQENQMVVNAISSVNLPWIWTGAQKSGNGFVWANGRPVQGGFWSHTGGFGRPQPDNREGNENCLAVLNNVYQDGITWHDVACSHRKPTICEL